MIRLYTGVFQPEGTDRRFSSPSGPRGNTKTSNLVRQAKKAVLSGEIVFTNFYTTSPLGRPFTRVDSFKEMMAFAVRNQDEVKKRGLKIRCVLTEAWKVYGKYLKAEDEDALKFFNNQIRKLHVNIDEDTQRSKDLPPLLRDAVNEVNLPYKMHDNGTVCKDELCKAHHISVVLRMQRDPLTNKWYTEEVDRFDINTVLDLYNSEDTEQVPEPGGTLFDLL